MTPETKAAGFLSQLKVMRGLVGEAAFEKFLGGLPPDLAELARRPGLPVQWLPMAPALEIANRAWKVLFDDDPEKIFELGRRQLKEDLSTIYRVFIRFGSPGFVVARAAALFGTYIRNGGTLTPSRNEDKLAEVVCEDFPLPSPGWWHYLRGTIQGATEASRASGVATKIVDGGGSARRCVYRVTWL